LAHLYYLTIVVSDIENQLSCDIDIIAFPKIGDRELLPVNKTIYYWSRSNCNGKMPEQIHLMCSVIKSKEPLREIANVINQLKRDEMYNTLTDRILSMIATTATRSIITNFVLDLAHIVGRYLGLINDKPIATVINSFTRIHGDWSNFGVTPLSINVKNVTFYFELIVRNSSFFSKSKLLPEYGIPDHQSMTRLF
jgi:hypothetical protein